MHRRIKRATHRHPGQILLQGPERDLQWQKDQFGDILTWSIWNGSSLPDSALSAQTNALFRAHHPPAHPSSSDITRVYPGAAAAGSPI